MTVAPTASSAPDAGAASLPDVARRLACELRPLRFGAPVSYVYNPLEYAWEPHERYLQRYGGQLYRVLFLGMNPGPWGMAQTGVPFGDVPMVRDWLGITGHVAHPNPEHPKRPVEGFHCRRREVSGRRFWGWARSAFGTAQRFFEQCFVLNYCPLCFLEASGRNRTPDKLARPEREPLFARCDGALRDAVTLLRPTHVLGIGRFAADRAARALGGLDVPTAYVPHPSPANPAANRGWALQLDDAMRELDLSLPTAR
jgi:single-strand selective monofunctional uracil DNA glycosylase